MRWWLAVAFALIAALTAVIVAEVSIGRAEQAFRSRAKDFAAGAAVAGAQAIGQATVNGDVPATAVSAAANQLKIGLFVFDRNGRLLSDPSSHGIPLTSVPSRDSALSTALAGRRVVTSYDKDRRIVIALPLRTGNGRALLAVANRPELRTELGIVHDQVVEAALLAVLVGAAAGLLIAVLISRRLRRIASAASAIEQGGFETELRPGFRDELGDLAMTIDRMREHLRTSFSNLESERDRLRRLLERLHEGVIAVDRDLRVQFANGVAAGIVRSRSLDEGKPLPEPWPELSLRDMAETLFDSDVTATEARVSPYEGRTYSVVGIPPGRGSQTALLILTDISERERRERAEREFVANAAHELRTPLTAIKSAIEVLEAGAKDNPVERDRFLELVERQVTRLGRLVRTLLVLARAQTHQEALNLEPVELRPLLEQVAADVHPAEGVAVEVDCPPSLWALAQRDLAQQVLANLAANAVKHTDAGAITLSARSLPDGSVSLAVTDTGAGIPAANQARVFDRFYSSDNGERGGFGLGLAIVWESVRALGGEIEIESELGRGTTVRMTLAAAARAA